MPERKHPARHVRRTWFHLPWPGLRAGCLNSYLYEFLLALLSVAGSTEAWGPARPSASASALTESVSSGDGVTRIFDGHQFHRPSSTTVQGTSTVRTTNVSIRTPTARPTPMSAICDPPGWRPPPIANTAKVPARTRPAEVTVVPVTPSARATACRSGK